MTCVLLLLVLPHTAHLHTHSLTLGVAWRGVAWRGVAGWGGVGRGGGGVLVGSPFFSCGAYPVARVPTAPG